MRRRGPQAGRDSAIAIVAVFVALAAFAGSASAAATTTKAEWYSGAKESSVTTLTGKAPLTASASGKLELMFPLAGSPQRMQANSASCVECTITNEASGLPGVATGTGRLLFSEASFVEGFGFCRFKEGKITSEPLRFEAHYMDEERWFMKISPASGEVAMTLNIESQTGSTCPYAGSGTPVKGVNFAEFKAKTGSFAAEQQIRFSEPISETGGSHWMFGTEPFWLTGNLNLKAGGLYFGAK
jgi:hypothetical protein